MQKLEAVERARIVMTEAIDWPDWQWLFQKDKVRALADLASKAFETANREARDSWTGELKQAYAGRTGVEANQIREADEEAARVTLEAETMFAEAEARLNAMMARDAARKALQSFDLREKALEAAQAAGKAAK